MPLPTPDLDTRTFDDLVNEAVTRIPRLAPPWTDHNAHDPGITLLELVAWLTELLLFRADRVTPAAQRAFLRLVGVRSEPAGVADTVVALRRPPGDGGEATLGPNLRVTTADRGRILEGAGTVPVSPAWLELEAGETTRRGAIETPTGALNQATGQQFAPFGADPQPGAALRLGFEELPAAPGDELRLHVWTTSWEHDAEDAARIRAEWGDLEHHDARVIWEYRVTADDWRPLEVVSDTTRALTLTGEVRLRGPAEHPLDPDSNRHWIRCRLLAGAFDCPPQLALIAVNPVVVRDAVARGPEPLGGVNGGAFEELELADRPVVAGSTRLRVSGPDLDVDDTWREVAEWDETGPDDRHYRLDPDSGTISFGDGQTGRVPQAGAIVTARRYWIGGGADGNLPAGRLVTSPDTAFAVVQPFAVTGGAVAEPVERAQGRALAMLERPVRAITVEDLEALARETPGVRLGRAVAVPDHHPAYGCLVADGVVTVVVLPASGDRAFPTNGLLAAVSRYLCHRRILASELHVVGPVYVPVTVTATLHVACGSQTTPALAAATLDGFLHPLRGGEGGDGWPLGRPVLESEVMALLGELDDVAYVDDVGISGPDDVAPRCGGLQLCPLELPDSGPHRITVEDG